VKQLIYGILSWFSLAQLVPNQHANRDVLRPSASLAESDGRGVNRISPAPAVEIAGTSPCLEVCLGLVAKQQLDERRNALEACSARCQSPKLRDSRFIRVKKLGEIQSQRSPRCRARLLQLRDGWPRETTRDGHSGGVGINGGSDSNGHAGRDMRVACRPPPSLGHMVRITYWRKGFLLFGLRKTGGECPVCLTWLLWRGSMQPHWGGQYFAPRREYLPLKIAPLSGIEDCGWNR
jgi:hypothetical protein